MSVVDHVFREADSLITVVSEKRRRLANVGERVEVLDAKLLFRVFEV